MHECIEVRVRDLRRVEFVVQVEVMGHLLAELANAGLGVDRIGHVGDATRMP